MPLNAKGNEVKGAMEKEYGGKKGDEVFYASVNKGKVKGVGCSDKVDEIVVRCDAFDKNSMPPRTNGGKGQSFPPKKK